MQKTRHAKNTKEPTHPSSQSIDTARVGEHAHTFANACTRSVTQRVSTELSAVCSGKGCAPPFARLCACRALAKFRKCSYPGFRLVPATLAAARWHRCRSILHSHASRAHVCCSHSGLARESEMRSRASRNQTREETDQVLQRKNCSAEFITFVCFTCNL